MSKDGRGVKARAELIATWPVGYRASLSFGPSGSQAALAQPMAFIFRMLSAQRCSILRGGEAANLEGDPTYAGSVIGRLAAG